MSPIKRRPDKTYQPICIILQSVYIGPSYYIMIFLVQNSFPMREWHVEHMEKIVTRYVKGISEDASAWEKRNHKKYGGLAHVSRQIEYDIKHGVAHDQVISTFQKLRHDSSFSTIRKVDGSMERLAEIEDHFTKPKIQMPSWY